MEIFSAIDLVNQCLIDQGRVEAFAKAIQQCVKKNSVVLEIGTGSGILALLAAKAGAKKVYTVEIEPYVAKTARQIIRHNGYERIVDVIEADAMRANLPLKDHIDVIVAELLTTGMVDESQVPVFNNLHKQKIISPSCTIIPVRVETTVQLVAVDFKVSGFELPMVKHIWRQYTTNPSFTRLSVQESLHVFDFQTPIAEEFKKNINFHIKNSGVANGVLLESNAWLTEKIPCTNTVAFLAPVIVPLEPRRIKKGDVVEASLDYRFGGGYRNFHFIYCS